MNKKKSILILLALNIAIVISGIAFSIYCYMENVSFLILNTNVAGYVLGAVIVFIGIRQFSSLKRLHAQINQYDSSFSWENFGLKKHI